MVTIPRGLKIEKIDDNKTIIKTDKKELVLSDYLGIFFCCFGFGLWIFGLIDTGFTEFYKIFSIVFLGLIGLFLLSFIFSFYEKQTIIITNEFIEIIKNRPLFSSREKIARNLIVKYDFKELRYPFFGFFGIVIMFKFLCNIGYYKIPRIQYKEDDIYTGGEKYILERYRINIREWIVEYLNEEIKRN